jgi:hypothetical protein
LLGLPLSGSRAGAERLGSERDGSDLDGSDRGDSERDGSDLDGSDRGDSERDGSERDGSDRDGSDRGDSDRLGSDRGDSEREGRSELSDREGRAGSLRGSLRGASTRGDSTREGGVLRWGGSYDGVDEGESSRRSGRAGSTRSRFREGLSLESELAGCDSLVTGRRSGPGSLIPVLLFPDSEERGGLVTAPLGRVSTVVPVEVSTVGLAGRASRPFRTRVRRNSSSKATPGVLTAAPVTGGVTITDGRAGLAICESALAVLAGRPFTEGSLPITRRAKASAARVGFTFSLPSSRALAEVTARN